MYDPQAYWWGRDACAEPLLCNFLFGLNVTAQLHTCLVGELGDFSFAFTVTCRSVCPSPEWEKSQVSLQSSYPMALEPHSWEETRKKQNPKTNNPAGYSSKISGG